MRSFTRHAAILLGCLLLLAGDCNESRDTQGPGSPEPTESVEPTEPPVTSGLTESDVRACLEAEGLRITAPGEESPTLGGVKGIGLQPGDGALSPGNVTGAVFVYGSEEEAESAAESVQGFAGEVVQEGNVVVMFDSDAPTASLSSTVDGCITA